MNRFQSLLISLSAMISVVAMPSLAQINFLSAFTLPAGINTEDVVSCDIDGDGFEDLIVSNYVEAPAGGILIYRNLSHATLAPDGFSSPVFFQTLELARGIAVGDINLDGKSDIAIGCTNTGDAGFVCIFENNSTPGNIVLNARVDLETQRRQSTDVALVDLDKDGWLDVVCTNTNSASLTIFAHTGTSGAISGSTFSGPTHINTNATPFGLDVADLNGDYLADLAVSHQPSGTLSIHLNKSTPGNTVFDPQVVYSTGGNTPLDVRIADLDGDGLQDVATCNQNTKDVSIFRNTSNLGSFSLDPAVLFPVDGSLGLLIADFDRDGRGDIICTGQNSSPTVSVFRNVSSAGMINSSSFDRLPSLPVGTNPHGVASSDLNQDGLLDLVVCNHGSSTLSVLTNNTPLPTGSVAGHVTAGTSGLSGVLVRLLDQSGFPVTEFDQVTTDNTGEYTIAGIPVGDYQVTIAEPSGYDCLENTKPVVVLLGATSSVDFVLTTSLLVQLGPAEVFVGVTNSDNNGRRIDLKLEVFRNEVDEDHKVSEGVLAYQQVAGNALNNSKKFTIELAPFDGVPFSQGDILKLRLSIRRVGGSGNFGVRFWYNDDLTTSKSRGWNRVAKTVEGGNPATHYYFREDYSLGSVSGNSGMASVLTATTEYQDFGTWSLGGSLMKRQLAHQNQPYEYSLEQNYPNPFNPATTISYSIRSTGTVRLAVYNSLGQLVAVLVDGHHEPGQYQIVWHAADQPSGVYFYRLEAGDYVRVNRMLLIK